jgi:exopolysaccharide biosynthesis polyprenyl glycosylphosphotransferase
MQQELGSATLVGRLRGPSVAELVTAPARPATHNRAWRVLLPAGSDLAAVAVVSLLIGGTWAAALIRVAGTVLAFAIAGLYRSRLRYSALDDLPRLFVSACVVAAAAAWLGAAVPPVLWFALVAGAAVGRGVVYVVPGRLRGAGAGVPTLVIGSGEVAVRLAEALVADRGYGLAPIGLVGPPPVTEPELPAPLLGSVDELDTIITTRQPRSVIVAFPGLSDAALVGTLRRCRRLGIAVYVVPRLFDLAVGHAGVELVGGVPLARMQPEPPRRWRRAVKRGMDIAGALTGLVLLWPVFAACALAVRWESGRAGILFRQERIGLSGRPFTILKFRSLTPASAEESQVRWNIRTDDRVGPVGRILRGTSLDELPQLVNVLRGDMSLVGPRPERPYFVEQFTRMYDGYPDRHRVLGGITGWAQIHGLRGDTSIADRVRFDNYYVENWSPALDLKIIVRTLGSMLSIRRR